MTLQYTANSVFNTGCCTGVSVQVQEILTDPSGTIIYTSPTFTVGTVNGTITIDNPNKPPLPSTAGTYTVTQSIVVTNPNNCMLPVELTMSPITYTIEVTDIDIQSCGCPVTFVSSNQGHTCV